MSIFDIFKKQKEEVETSTLKKVDRARIRAEIERLKKDQLAMNVDAEAEEVEPDACKIGGKPFVPNDFQWPVFISKEDNIAYPLSFFCQLNLSELTPFDKEKILPDKGILLFFYECESLRWGFDPEDKGAARVYYFEDMTNFAASDIPEDLNEDYVIPEIAVSFETKKSFPMFDEFRIHSDAECDWDDYDDILADFGVKVEDIEEHKVLGYADIIQDEMLTECERAIRGLDCGNPESYQNTPADVRADILEIKEKTKFKKWSFGHYHVNQNVTPAEIALLEQIIRIA